MKKHFEKKGARDKIIKAWKTKEKKGDNIPRSCQSCQNNFSTYLSQT
jgi:hypothetical protein